MKEIAIVMTDMPESMVGNDWHCRACGKATLYIMKIKGVGRYTYPCCQGKVECKEKVREMLLETFKDDSKQ